MKRFLCVLCLVCLFVAGAAAESAYDPFVPETLIETMGQILPLVPEARRTIGLAIAAGAKAGPATRRFADYVVRYVTAQK